MSPRRRRIGACLLIATALALGLWHFAEPWWTWILFGLLVGRMLTHVGRDHESDRR
jgi:uncharacterized membrane protein YbaN (DUF454 family)